MIVINARFLTQPTTGVQRFAIEISKLLKLKYKDKVCFVTCKGVIHKDLAKELNAKVIGINKSHVWEQLDLYIFLLKKGKPLLLSFGYTGPLFYKNQIISIHDVAFKLYRKSFSKSFTFMYNFLVPRIAKKCLHVLTVSNSAKEELNKELYIPKEKITVIYNGISSIFRTTDKAEFKKPERPFILTVSSHHPRKNYKRLIEAFERLNNKSINLYVVGNVIKHFTLNDELKQSPNVKYLRNVTDKELLAYYQNAELFVFPSLYEGFGIPVIEAMSQNLPCVISDIPVFKEIGDDTVTYVDPLDVESISKGIQETLKNPKLNYQYPKLKQFKWDYSAEKVANLLDSFKKN